MFFHMVYINLDRSFYRFVTIHACDGRTDGQTDRQTDRILIARPRLHSMQRGKNCKALIFMRNNLNHTTKGKHASASTSSLVIELKDIYSHFQ